MGGLGGHEGHGGSLPAVMLLMNQVKTCLFLIIFTTSRMRQRYPAEINFARPETNSFSVPHLLSAAPRAVYASVTPAGLQQTKGEKKH